MLEPIGGMFQRLVDGCVSGDLAGIGVDVNVDVDEKAEVELEVEVEADGDTEARQMI